MRKRFPASSSAAYKKWLLKQQFKPNDEHLLQLAAWGSSTLACGLLASSTVTCVFPQNDPRVQATEKYVRRVLKAQAEYLEEMGVEAVQPTPEMLGMKIKDGIPVVTGRIVGPDPKLPDNWLVDAYCPYCQHQHNHGWGIGDSGHRGAHCTSYPNLSGSPLLKTGYFIELDEASQRIVEKAKQQKQ